MIFSSLAFSMLGCRLQLDEVLHICLDTSSKTASYIWLMKAPNVITTLIVLLSDSDSATVAVAWEALSRVVGSVPKEVLPSYIKLVRDAVSTSRDKERRKRKGGPVLIPGLCLPKALQPLLPIFLQVCLFISFVRALI
ncbi:protein ILITYHIA-like [Camellia sinensis]|uniref:protein ILITYHIA-like n=1 Tax=Camellia sinensis TaxID=4442 RepID=UPI001036947C|nr:protein ILITYHIA-like [Camellia sinensis]